MFRETIGVFIQRNTNERWIKRRLFITKNTDGTPLVNGKKVTCFSNTEEDAVQLTHIVPFLVENMLKENGGLFMKSDDWLPYAVEDGLLITGQNPASSELVAEMLLKKIKG